MSDIMFNRETVSAKPATMPNSDQSSLRDASLGRRRLFEYLPVSLFGSVMGLTGLSLAWRLAHARYGAPDWISNVIGAVAMLAFIFVSAAYGLKAVTAWDAVRAEFRHPIAGNLFGTIPISLLLLPFVVSPISLVLAQALWIAGAVGMSVFAWIIVSRWMTFRQRIEHATPAWIVPVVGLLDLPLALPSLGLPPMYGVMVFGLAVGLFFAVPLFTLVFSRLVFETPIAPALQPMLMILVAPFAVGFSAYVATTGQVDLFAESLYVLMLFILAVVAGRMRQLRHCCPFRISWWAVSFPLAAAATAALRFAAAEPGLVTDGIALLLLAIASLVIALLLARTLAGVVRGELRSLSL